MESLITFILLFSIGALGAFLSGLVGIGGAIILFPMILFIPPIFNIEITPSVASGLTAAQVFFSTLSGSYSKRKSNDISKTIIVPMSIGILMGSIIGAISASFFNEMFINVVYTFLAIVAVFLMFIRVKPKEAHETYAFYPLLFIALIIGFLSGIVGAGGAFLIVPILLTIFKVPMRKVITNSIFIAFISSIGTFLTKAYFGLVDLDLAIPLVIASLIFAPIGTTISKKTNQDVLKVILSVLILLSALKMIYNMIA
ncbi:sulfite exporter TauE/SafE family protein [Macrococcus sp. DPC7161]|uniref:sulfite exporter TauE/SafE family protein n=1 Tax=Macrococcus sp. DPC7161 TaxID=2507060 RepID=UPI00100A6911|nr:sulfite exporter TauE/SafE family protein [Macrococcus sp. DPC7161]RXK18496.1 sulfite exporter TauE/SafE family protein [Macrococcus sp. DPC7161]